MHTLPEEFSIHNWTYTQVSREGDIAIYRQKHKTGTAVRYEGIVVQHLKEKLMPKGYVREAGEYYPGSSYWGLAGWSFYDLEEAQEHARALASTSHPAHIAI